MIAVKEDKVVVKEGDEIPANVAGMLTRLGIEPMEVGLHIVREGGSSILLMDGEDILRIADGLKMRRVITETEMKLLARNPLKTPKLLELRDRASKVSKRAWLIDPSTPQDAYRHVLWSYLLTRAYGSEFAREVTGVLGPLSDKLLLGFVKTSVGPEGLQFVGNEGIHELANSPADDRIDERRQRSERFR